MGIFAVRNCLAWRMGLLVLVSLSLLVCLTTSIKFDDDHHHAVGVERPETFGQVDSNGDFGHFTVRRCVKIQEGKALCRYKVHYDVPHDEVSLIGRKGLKCITKQKKIARFCKTKPNKTDLAVKINKKQLVDIEFKQHCVHIKHDLRGKVREANILASCHIVQGKGKGKGKDKGKGKPTGVETRQASSLKWKGD